MISLNIRLRTKALVLLGGCAVPDSMPVRDGGAPRHADEDVLFRATGRTADHAQAPSPRCWTAMSAIC